MNISNTYEHGKTIYVLPQVWGTPLDFTLGEELPLFGPPANDGKICGVGYNSYKRRKALGMPYFKTGPRTPYKRWLNMIQRCYRGEKVAYDGCTVCLKWHDYQEFAAWFTEQPYACESDAELDKDILDRLNTVYSPESCSVVPKVINQVFRNTRSRRGRLPLGVSVAPGGNGFVSVISMFGQRVELGKKCHDIAEAFERYQSAHRAYCAQLADRYESKLDARVLRVLRAHSRHMRD